jgi:hypothetical protein
VKVKGVSSVNLNGEIFRNDPFSGTYTVTADCTATVTYTGGSQIDVFIVPDGSMLTAARTKALRVSASSCEFVNGEPVEEEA